MDRRHKHNSSVKDKNNVLTHALWSCGDYDKTITFTESSVTHSFIKEHATNGEYSLKITGTGWIARQFSFSNDWNSVTASGNVFTTSTKGTFGVQISYADSTYVNHEVTVPDNILSQPTVTGTIDKTKTITFMRVYFNLHSSTTTEAFIDNLNLIPQ